MSSRLLKAPDVVTLVIGNACWWPSVSRLGYGPKLLAGNLHGRKTLALRAAISDIKNPHFAQMMRVASDAADAIGFRAMLCNTDGSQEKQRPYLRRLMNERASRAIIAPSDPGMSCSVDPGPLAERWS